MNEWRKRSSFVHAIDAIRLLHYICLINRTTVMQHVKVSCTKNQDWCQTPNLRNRRWGGCVYVLQMFFFVFAFSVHYKNTRQPFLGTAERIFMKLLPNDSGENGVCIAVPKWGLGPRLIFWGLKILTWWWRLASDSELVCWLWHCAATAFALKKAWARECI